jgi:cytochrome c peroxidase
MRCGRGFTGQCILLCTTGSRDFSGTQSPRSRLIPVKAFPLRSLAEFPPAIYLTPRTDLGDVSQGKLVSLTNYYQLFNGILTPRQLEGLRLLLTPFPQQQFNATEDRRSELPSIGSACFDCHSNGHQNGATHLAPDARPQEFRHRIKTVSLRGVDSRGQVFDGLS